MRLRTQHCLYCQRHCHLALAYGGLAATLLELALSEEEDVTTFTVRDALYGQVPEKTCGSLESGWRQLFDGWLRAYAEGA